MAGKGTTIPGYVNRNGQVTLDATTRPSTTHINQTIYVMHCPKCVHNYGANGCDLLGRLCPYHQGGKPGEPLQGDEWDWRP